MTMLDVQEYYKKLANDEPVPQKEIEALLKAYKVAITLAGYMASCHAATAEGLPASAPLSAKKRMWQICQSAVKGLDGDIDTYRAGTPESAQDRCRKTMDELGIQIRAQEAATAQRANERKAAKGKKVAP